MSGHELYGLMAEFHAPEEIVKAAEAVHAAGYRKVDAYTPYPMEEVLDALHLHETHVPKLALTGGLVGLVGGWLFDNRKPVGPFLYMAASNCLMVILALLLMASSRGKPPVPSAS